MSTTEKSILKYINTTREVDERTPEEQAYVSLFASSSRSKNDVFLEELEKCLSQNFEINIYKYQRLTGHPITLLLNAILCCNPASTRILCQRIKDFRKLSILLHHESNGMTPLAYAAALGCFENVETLLDTFLPSESEKQINYKNKDGYPIDYAIRTIPLFALFSNGVCENGEIASNLQYAYIRGRFPEGEFTIRFNGNLSIIKALLKKSKNLNAASEFLSDVVSNAKQFTSMHNGSPLTFHADQSKGNVVVFTTVASNIYGEGFPNTKLKIIADFSQVKALIETAKKQLDFHTTKEDKESQEALRQQESINKAEIGVLKEQLEKAEQDQKARLEDLAKRQNDLVKEVKEVQERVEQLCTLTLTMYDKGFAPTMNRQNKIDILKQKNPHAHQFFRFLVSGLFTIISKARHGTALDGKLRAETVISKTLQVLADHISLPVISGLIKAGSAAIDAYGKSKNSKACKAVENNAPIDERNVLIDLVLGIMETKQFRNLKNIGNARQSEKLAAMSVLLIFTLMCKMDAQQVDPDSPKFISYIIQLLEIDKHAAFETFRKEVAGIPALFKPLSSRTNGSQSAAAQLTTASVNNYPGTVQRVMNHVSLTPSFTQQQQQMQTVALAAQALKTSNTNSVAKVASARV